MSNKNKVGLALMIGDDIAEDANRSVGSHGRVYKEDHRIILIEKTRHILSDNNYTPVTSD
jgi:nitrous oxidase accessory protein NosD